MTLTRGALARICAGGKVPKPKMQVLGYKKIAGSGQERYRILLSDGEFSNSFAMLATQLNPMIHNKELERFTTIRVDKYVCNSVLEQNKSIIIILEVSVIKPGEQVGKKIGNPTPMGGDGSAKVHIQNANSTVGQSTIKRQQPPSNHEAKKPMVNDQPRMSVLISRQRFERINKLNKEMGDLEKKLKENIGSRKQKRMDLIERQNVEKKNMTKKHKEEETAMIKRHKDEQTMLETTLAREDQVEQRSIANLRERRDYLWKLTSDGDLDFSGDRGKVEAAERSLECPICFDLMRPPTRIWMCQLSHIICEPCKDGLDKQEHNKGICPTCMTQQVNLRATLAENFARATFNE